jgi:hypothetical protein
MELDRCAPTEGRRVATETSTERRMTIGSTTCNSPVIRGRLDDQRVIGRGVNGHHDESDGELLQRRARSVATPQVPGKRTNSIDPDVDRRTKSRGRRGRHSARHRRRHRRHPARAARRRRGPTPRASTPPPPISRPPGRRPSAVASAIASRTGTATSSTWPSRSLRRHRRELPASHSPCLEVVIRNTAAIHRPRGEPLADARAPPRTGPLPTPVDELRHGKRI